MTHTCEAVVLAARGAAAYASGLLRRGRGEGMEEVDMAAEGPAALLTPVLLLLALCACALGLRARSLPLGGEGAAMLRALRHGSWRGLRIDTRCMIQLRRVSSIRCAESAQAVSGMLVPRGCERAASLPARLAAGGEGGADFVAVAL